jgi:tripeptide aminopeptidase
MPRSSPAAARLPPIDSERLLDRFLRYVQVDTTADADAETYPSSPGQLELGRMLVAELHAAGLADASQDAHGIVWATVPSTLQHAAATIAFFAHLDTSPETNGKNVRPQVVRDYAGGDLILPGDNAQVIRIAENPALESLQGKTLITTDGTTLLGADDKAGVAVIMEAAAWLMEHPDVPHGPLRLCFTCDEEIGRGVDHIDVAQLGATAGYTLDGEGSGAIDVETFSADLARVTVRGVNIHPSIGKGRLVNALRYAAAFLEQLPKQALAPETTDGRQGFLHPYHIEGGVAEATLRILLRDFETPRLKELAAILFQAGRDVAWGVQGLTINIELTKQYRNLREGLAKEPRAVAYAQQAYRRLKCEPRLTIIRGGTDGAILTERGLPTPNLSSGQHNPHSPLEWTCLEELAQATQVVIELARVWGE